MEKLKEETIEKVVNKYLNGDGGGGHINHRQSSHSTAGSNLKRLEHEMEFKYLVKNEYF